MGIAINAYEQLDNKSTKDTRVAYTWKDNSTSKDKIQVMRESINQSHV